MEFEKIDEKKFNEILTIIQQIISSGELIPQKRGDINALRNYLNKKIVQNEFNETVELIQQLIDSGKLKPHKNGVINALRIYLGLTLADMSSIIGISQPRMSKIEQSEKNKNIKLSTLFEIANAFDYDVVYFLVPKKEKSIDNQG